MTYHAVCHDCEKFEAVVENPATAALDMGGHTSATGHHVSIREVDE